MSLERKLDQVLARYQELSALMSQPYCEPKDFARMSKEYSDLTPVVQAVEGFRRAKNDLAETEKIIGDPSSDGDMKALAQEEYKSIKEQLPGLEKNLMLALLPKDAADSRNAILEIRAGTGGDEAALFANDLFEMYRLYAAQQGWRFEVMEMSPSDIGGLKEVVVNISGDSVFSKLKFESGVHRVQRVPKTEASGRIHTSAATVAVLPEAEDVDVRVDEKDLKIDTFRAGGAGGQHVNKTESAIRITHIPTGIVVAVQDEKSQHKNRAQAMKILRSKLYEAEREKLARERAQSRKEQVGSGDRSERIRTYNFPQSRVTDHRINLTLYQLSEVMNGKSLDELIEPLMAQDQAEKLAEMGW